MSNIHLCHLLREEKKRNNERKKKGISRERKRKTAKKVGRKAPIRKEKERMRKIRE